MLADAHRWWARTQFSPAVRLRLYRKIATMLTNGLPLLKVLDELWERASSNGKKTNEPLAIVLADCRRMVKNGFLLCEGLDWWIPDTEKMIIMAGEQSGRLEGTLTVLVGVVQAQQQIRSVIAGGLMYPLAIGSLIIAYIYLFGMYVIPQFARVVDPLKWRGTAQSLYLMSQVVQNWLLYLVAALLVLLALLLFSLPRWRGNLRVLLDRVAPFSIYRLLVGSGFLLAFSALQFAGITVEKSLLRLANQAEPWLRERLDGALLGVKSGLNCGEALRNSGYEFPSREVIDDLCVYAEYKGFAEALKVLADEWVAEGVARVTAQMKVLNGFAVVTLAIVIAWMVTGFFGIQQEIASMTRAV